MTQHQFYIPTLERVFESLPVNERAFELSAPPMAGRITRYWFAIRRSLVWPMWRALSSERKVPRNVIRHACLETDSLIEVISKMEHAIERVYRGDIGAIVAGYHAFASLRHEVYERAIGPIAFEMRMSGDGGLKVIGLPLYVIPWFEGVLLLPKEICKS